MTRTREQARSLVEPLEALGAEVLAFPVLETVDPEDWAPGRRRDRASSPRYDWVVLTSTNGVDRFLQALPGGRGLARRDSGHAGSPRSARRPPRSCAKHGLPPALVPADFRAEGLVEAFREMGAGPGCRVLIPRAEEAREVLPDELRAMGCDVDVVCVYRTQRAVADPAVVERLRAGTVDVVTFTSGAIARGFVSAMRVAGLDAEQVLGHLAVASIGPVTSEAIRDMGSRRRHRSRRVDHGLACRRDQGGPLGRSLAPDDQKADLETRPAFVRAVKRQARTVPS